MGRAINTENRQDQADLRQDGFDNRLKLIEDAVAELSRELLPKGTRVHHVDLTEGRSVRAKDNEGELRSPVTIKRSKKKAKTTVTQ